MPAITYCPPAAALTEAFDPHIFAGTHLRAVNGHATAEGFDGGGIGFDDYSRMHTKVHKLAGQRRLDTPTWVMRKEMMANVIAHYCLNRAGVRYHIIGTPEEKLKLAKLHTVRRREKMVVVIDSLCRRYVAAKSKTPCDYREVRRLEIEIENSDTALLVLDKEAEIAAGVLYHYYHRHADSPAVAQALGIKPPHVRVMIWRLRRVAAELGYDKHVSSRNVCSGNKTRTAHEEMDNIINNCWRRSRRSVLSGKDADTILKLHNEGKGVAEIAKSIGYPRNTGKNRVRKFLETYDTPRASKDVGGRPVLYPCDEQVVVKMFHEGKRVCEIAEQFFGERGGFAHNRIRAVLRHAGLLK
jgi:hypothetical protein